MKFLISGTGRFHPCLRTILLTVLLLGLANPLFAAAGGRKLLKLEITQNRSVAEVVVPRGYSTVSLQRFDRNDGWVKVAARKVKPGVAKFKLPSVSRGTRWRAIGTFDATINRSKFPKSFYKGNRWFGPLASSDVGKEIYYRMDSNPPGVAGRRGFSAGGSGHLEDRRHLRLFLQPAPRPPSAGCVRNRPTRG